MSTNPKVMVVDDSELVITWVKGALEPEFTVVGLQTTFGVGAAIIREKPSVVLVDVRMPLLGGEDVVALARKSDVGGRTPILLFSSLPVADLQQRAKSCGADGYIPKSGDAYAFRRRVTELVQGAHKGSAASDPWPKPVDLSFSPRTILVADPVGTLLLEPFFARQEFRTERVDSGQQVCDRLRYAKPDLLLIGSDLTDMPASDLVARIRSDQDLRNVSIMYLGAAGDNAGAEATRRAGANEALLRPASDVDIGRLIGKLAAVALRREARLLIRVEVKLKRDQGFQVGFSHNLSASGMLLEGDTSLQLGTALGLSFFIPDTTEETKAEGRIVRIHSESDSRRIVGVGFTNLASADRDVISAFVADNQSLL